MYPFRFKNHFLTSEKCLSYCYEIWLPLRRGVYTVLEMDISLMEKSNIYNYVFKTLKETQKHINFMRKLKVLIFEK